MAWPDLEQRQLRLLQCFHRSPSPEVVETTFVGYVLLLVSSCIVCGLSSPGNVRSLGSVKAIRGSFISCCSCLEVCLCSWM
uniref:Uncharacterized protein n=1 Tax=Physcomitrium patens TaxID=3218 RepID=A0A2K1JZW5_PHYPA|nr:hypothetical protein PHYPA_014180 [Physcomitrium patens]